MNYFFAVIALPTPSSTNNITIYYPCNVTTTSFVHTQEYPAATSVGNLALFGGGQDISGWGSNVVNIFNGDSNTWSVAHLSQYKVYVSATSVGHLALFAGGYYYDNGGQSGNSNVVDIFDARSNSWTNASLHQARSSFAATSVGNLALFAGGSTDSENSNVVDIFNASSNTWTVAFLSEARASLAATSVGNLALFGGGTNIFGPSAVVDIFDATSNTWFNASLSDGRYWLAATSIGNLAFFAGGHDNIGPSNVVDIYNADLNSWTSASLSQPRQVPAAVTLGNLVLFSGWAPVIDIFNASSNTWITTPAHTAEYPGTVIGDRALFFGSPINKLATQVLIFTASPSCVCEHSVVNLQNFACDEFHHGTMFVDQVLIFW